MIIDGTLKDGEMGVYKDLHNGWVEKIETINIKNQTPPIAKYGSVDIDELLKIMEKFKEIPDYDTLIKDNNKKDKEIVRLKEINDNLYDELVGWLGDYENNIICSDNYGKYIYVGDLIDKIDELKEGK